MAKSTPRRGAPPRAAAKSKKVAVTEVDVVEDGGGDMSAGIAIFTTIVMVAALVILDMVQGKNGDGILF